MKPALWIMIFALHILSCHAQTQAKPPEKPIVTSIRLTSLLFSPFTIIAVAQPEGRVYCDDAEAQRSFRDLSDLAEIIYNHRMLSWADYYGISMVECACPGFVADFEVKRRSSDDIIVYCRKSS